MRQPLIVGGCVHAPDIDLRDSITRSFRSDPGHRNIPLEQGKHVADHRVMPLCDQRLRASIGDRPQHRHRLRNREDQIETRDGSVRRLLRFLCFNQRLLRGTLCTREGPGEALAAAVDPLRDSGESPVRATQLLARVRILPMSLQPPQLRFAHRSASRDISGQTPEPSQTPGGTHFKVVACQRCDSISITIASYDRVQQAPIYPSPEAIP